MYQPQRTKILLLLLAMTCSIFAGSVASAQGLPVEVEEVTTIPAIMLPKEELNEKRVAVLSDIIATPVPMDNGAASLHSRWYNQHTLLSGIAADASCRHGEMWRSNWQTERTRFEPVF